MIEKSKCCIQNELDTTSNYDALVAMHFVTKVHGRIEKRSYVGFLYRKCPLSKAMNACKISQ